MYAERLRRRRLRHMLLANLNLLTHILPKLLPDVGSTAKATTGCHGGAQARAALDQWRRNYGLAGDKSVIRKCLHVTVGRRRIGRSVTAFQSVLMKSNSHIPLEESAAKSRPPSSVKSFQDSGVGYSESPVHSVPSVDTSGAPNSSPVEDIGGNSGESTPLPPITSGQSHSTPSPDVEIRHLASNISKKCGSPQNASTLCTKPKNLLILESTSTEPPDKCCIPPCVFFCNRLKHWSAIRVLALVSWFELGLCCLNHFLHECFWSNKSGNSIFSRSLQGSSYLIIPLIQQFFFFLFRYVADPLKPLLRFLSASEANTLLNQLHSASDLSLV